MPLTIIVPSMELWDEKNSCFYNLKEQELQLEHSLISLSKWESKHHKPFLCNSKRTEKSEKTPEEMTDYIRCMTINKGVDPVAYYHLTKKNIEDIQDYINDPMTATTFREDPEKPKVNVNGNFTTAEIIYYQMYKLNIPNEWEKRHLNRLLALIRVMAIKEEEANNPKKMNKNDWMKQQRALHAARRKPRK